MYIGLAITESISKFNRSINTTTLTLVWTPATNQYCEVLYYMISLYSSEYSSMKNESGLSTSGVFTDVKSSTDYNIMVTAFTEAGNISDTILNVRMTLDTTKGLFCLEGFICICNYVVQYIASCYESLINKICSNPLEFYKCYVSCILFANNLTITTNNSQFTLYCTCTS